MTALPLTFVSSLRRGFVAQAGQTTDVSLQIGATPPIERKLPVLGPGDATGIDPRQVIRSNPAPGATDVESNYLALVEFDRPDLPWMFSPAPIDGRLVPWMMLVVIDVTDATDPIAPGVVRPQLTADVAELGDPTEAWLWAHAQVLGSDASDLDRDPSRSLSRLLCPRRLQPMRRYLACVVPTFAAGVEAGLGHPVNDALRVSTQPAWTPTAGRVTVPVYHQFGFTTGPAGDFEQLVRRLRGVPLPTELGRRHLTLDHARSGLPVPEPAGATVELHAALRPPGATLPPIASLTGASYVDVLRTRLADAGYDVSLVGGEPPAVGPPIYGQFACRGPQHRPGHRGTSAPTVARRAEQRPAHPRGRPSRHVRRAAQPGALRRRSMAAGRPGARGEPSPSAGGVRDRRQHHAVHPLAHPARPARAGGDHVTDPRPDPTRRSYPDRRRAPAGVPGATRGGVGRVPPSDPQPRPARSPAPADAARPRRTRGAHHRRRTARHPDRTRHDRAVRSTDRRLGRDPQRRDLRHARPWSTAGRRGGDARPVGAGDHHDAAEPGRSVGRSSTHRCRPDAGGRRDAPDRARRRLAHPASRPAGAASSRRAAPAGTRPAAAPADQPAATPAADHRVTPRPAAARRSTGRRAARQPARARCPRSGRRGPSPSRRSGTDPHDVARPRCHLDAAGRRHRRRCRDRRSSVAPRARRHDDRRRNGSPGHRRDVPPAARRNRRLRPHPAGARRHRLGPRRRRHARSAIVSCVSSTRRPHRASGSPAA